MELVAVHLMEPVELAAVRAGLVASTPPRGLHRRAEVDVALAGPWRPSDLWEDAPERPVWTATFRLPRGAWLHDDAEQDLAERAGLAPRCAPVSPAEAVARHAGHGLVVVFSDAARLAYVAVYRQRRFEWSVLLHDGVRLVRADAHGAQVFAPPPPLFPEEDRTGVLLSGLRTWLRTAWDVPRAARTLLPETLAEVTADAPWVRLVEGGGWLGLPALAPGRKLA
ncbi:MAG: hypothetical protein RLZZ299_3185 [Pseudomonadota bacterium]|jgi:hypothetical protein